MYIGAGTARVTATIDVRGSTEMHCVVDRDGDIELRIGGDADAYLFLTKEGADKLVRTLTDAQSGTPS